MEEKDEKKDEEGDGGGLSFSVVIVVGSGGGDWGGGGGGWGGEGSLGELEENGLNFHAVVADDDAREKPRNGDEQDDDMEDENLLPSQLRNQRLISSSLLSL